LDLLSKATLDDTQQTSFLSLRCELLVRLGRLDEARRVLTQIDRARLFPNEAGFLARLVEEKPAA
jgi:Flp pilus assembly protein TadD